jgi:hypothetical protein
MSRASEGALTISSGIRWQNFLVEWKKPRITGIQQRQRKMGLLKRAYKRRSIPYDGRYGSVRGTFQDWLSGTKRVHLENVKLMH